MIRGAEIGKRFDGATFDTYEMSDGTKAAHRACLQLARSEVDGVVLISPVGLGKTHLLVALAREYNRLNSYIPPVPGVSDMRAVPPVFELIEQADAALSEDTGTPSLAQSEIPKQVSIEFWPMLELVAELQRDAMEGGRVIDRIMRCPLLILDDMGYEKETTFSAPAIHRIIDYRYRAMLPIAVSTNLTRKKLIAKYGEKTISRWIESCEVITMTGDDYRVKKGRS